MLNNEPLFKEQLISLYSSGKSMRNIAQHLGCSVHKVVYWMNKHSIKRRSISEAVYFAENPEGDPFDIKRIYLLLKNGCMVSALGFTGEKVKKFQEDM